MVNSTINHQWTFILTALQTGSQCRVKQNRTDVFSFGEIGQVGERSRKWEIGQGRGRTEKEVGARTRNREKRQASGLISRKREKI